MKKLLVAALLMIAADSVADSGKDPASPAHWALPSHIAPLATDPRNFFSIGDLRWPSPLPRPCRTEQKRNGEIFEIQTASLTDHGAIFTIQNTINGLDLRIDLTFSRDSNGRLKKTMETSSEGDKDTCELDYDGDGRLAQEQCSNFCKSYRYDDRGRLILIRESMTGCGDWNSFVGYSYREENRLPNSIKYCEDEKLQNCYETIMIGIDSRGLVKNLERREGDKRITLENF